MRGMELEASSAVMESQTNAETLKISIENVFAVCQLYKHIKSTFGVIAGTQEISDGLMDVHLISTHCCPCNKAKLLIIIYYLSVT